MCGRHVLRERRLYRGLHPGWRAVDGSTIELTGTACQDWRSGDSDLEAVFPCDAVLVQ